MKKTSHIDIEINSELYKRFQALLVSKYGRTYGKRIGEIETALDFWIDRENKRIDAGGQ